MNIDYLIKNGTIIDGSGDARYEADLLVNGDRIISIFKKDQKSLKIHDENYNLNDLSFNNIIDATSHIIAPGFIDVHTHDDQNIFIDRSMSCKISQGVTTCIAGNCGISLAPFDFSGDVPAPIPLLGDKDAYRFSSVSSYKNAFNESPSSINISLLTGHSMLRVQVMNGEINRSATKDEIIKMQNILENALIDGSIGLSTGLAYPAANDAPTEEIIELAKVLKKHDGIFTTHMRNEGDNLVESVNETIKIGKLADVRTVISHHKCAGRSNWGKSKETLKLIKEAKKKQHLDLDCYPYTASSTMLLKHFVERADKVLVTWSDKVQDLKVNDINKIAKEFNCTIDELVDKLYPAGAIYFQMDDEDLNRIISFDGTMIGSDGLPGDKHPHPRLWGTFPRVLGKYSREMKLFSLEEAIYKMTFKSAKTFGLEKRGLIKKDYFADLVIFDPEVVIDKATYEKPLMPALGIDTVINNGQIVWQSMKSLNIYSGKFLEGKSFN